MEVVARMVWKARIVKSRREGRGMVMPSAEEIRDETKSQRLEERTDKRYAQ